MIDPDGGKSFDWYSDGNGNVLWKAGNAATIDVDGSTYSNIGKSHIEVVGNDLMVLGNGRSDVLGGYSLEDISSQATVMSDYITNPSTIAINQPEFSKFNGGVLGFEAAVGFDLPFYTESHIGGMGFMLHDANKGELFSFTGKEYGVKSSTDIGLGAGFQVFWGFSHISSKANLESFTGRYEYVMLDFKSVTIQVGFSESWIIFSLGGAGSINIKGTPSKSTVYGGFGHVDKVKRIKSFRQ